MLGRTHRSQFLKQAFADAAMVPTRLNRASLASVHVAALSAAPGESSQGEDFLLQRMVDGDCQSPVPVHFGHLAEKIRPMVRPPLQDVVLPLMNHLVRQRIHDLLLPVCAVLGDLLEQGKREANLAFAWRAKTLLIQSWPRASPTDEHADRGGQPAAPDEIDRRQQAREVAAIQFAPHSGQMLSGHWRGWAWSHTTGLPQLFAHGRGQQRHHDFVVADQRIAFSALLGRPPYHVGEGAVVSQEVHVHGRNVGQIVTKIASQ